MNNLTIHNVVSITVENVKERRLDDGSEYVTRSIVFHDKNGNKFLVYLFGDTIRNILMRDETLEELDEAAHEEAEYYAELSRGYAQDRI